MTTKLPLTLRATATLVAVGSLLTWISSLAQAVPVAELMTCTSVVLVVRVPVAVAVAVCWYKLAQTPGWFWLASLQATT